MHISSQQIADPYYEQEAFPIAKLDPEKLDYYYALVLKELRQDMTLQSDQRTERKTLEYGYSYFEMENGVFEYVDPPEFLIKLGKEVCKALRKPPESFSNFIISLYEPGYHLEPHADIDYQSSGRHGFYFSENVYGVILEPDATGHLYFVHYEGEDPIPPLDLKPVYSLKGEQGTVFSLQGQYRHAPYFHGVTNVTKRRISVTFRRVLTGTPNQ